MVKQRSKRRAISFQLYKSRVYLQDPDNAEGDRIAFILSKTAGPPPATIDPLARLSDGCLIDYAETSDPSTLLVGLEQTVNQSPDSRLIRIGPKGKPVWTVKGSVNGGVSSGKVSFGNSNAASGPITGNGRWRIELLGSVLKIEANRGLRFDLKGSWGGFYLDDTNRALPAEDDPTVIYEIFGERRGTWTLPTMLDQTQLDMMSVGASYFESNGIHYKQRFYPFYDLDKSERFLLELDCGDPYRIQDPPSRLTPPAHTLRTGINDVHGRRVMVAPLGKDSISGSFLLAAAPGRIEEGEITALTHQFVPSGDFLATDEKDLRISMGTSNLETVSLRGDAKGTVLQFEQGPALITDKDEFDDTADKFRTAWLKVPETALALDPEGMQPYRYIDANDGGMAFAPSALPQGGPSTIPFAPVLGLAAKSPSVAFDRERLSKARRSKFAAQKRAAMTDNLVEKLRTPQGYLGERTSSEFKNVVFTRTAARPKSGDAMNPPAGVDFGLVPIPGTEGGKILADLTARSRLFVVTRLDRLLQHFEAASLEVLFMADWRVRGAAAGSETNFVILKHDARPLYVPGAKEGGLLFDQGQWTMLEGLEALSPQEIENVQKQVRDGVSAAAKDDLFGPFGRRMTEANWAGLICINMVLDSMPDQLGALEALCENLAVHHIGVDLTAIQKTEQAVWKPAMFGLINQIQPGDFLPKKEKNPPLQLQLRELKLLVENDSVRRFDCTVLGRPAEMLETGVKAGSADFELKGLYQSRVTPDGQRQDSYTFEVTKEFTYSFDKDFVLDTIVITRASLVTLIDPNNRKDKSGRLLLDGWISFRRLGDVDLLGIKKLEFFDLGVLFGPASSIKLSFEYPSLYFDFDTFNRIPSINPDSFLARLPFKLSGFRIGDFSLGKLGYFDFGAIPGIGAGERGDKFKLALDFDLDLGSLGSLAKKLDRFKLNFLTGWLPDQKKFAIGFRIETGGSGGGLDLGVEGIIQLTADHFHVGMDGSGANRRLCLAADNARLKILSTPIPKDGDDEFSFYLLADPNDPSKLVEKIGWYGAYKKKEKKKGSSDGDSPVSIRHLALGQRLEIKAAPGDPPLHELRTTRQVLSTIKNLQTFDSDQKFLDFATKYLTHAPQRDWFVALEGSFFKVTDVQLLLRDPDMYGAYVKLLSYPNLFIDLLYTKLADGVGRYSGELDIREFIPQLDFGAFSVTMGVIGFEIYTDGGFLIDLGFPEHVDYSRSFVAQAGPFMGKGGLYVGRTPAAAIPEFGQVPAKDAFRLGVALRIGLGREIVKGPLFASLSVSAFGRIEGAVAQKSQALVPARRGEAMSDLLASYVFYLRGEIGIILEIEGRVDLRLVQARVLVRAWIAAGITLISAHPIILHAEAGVVVSVRFAIGRIKIFGKKITIYITLGYSTRLRYEWELKGGPRMVAVSAIVPTPWTSPKGLSFASTSLQLRLTIEISRRGPGDAVMVPMATILGPADGAPHPLGPLGKALIEWAANSVLKDSDPTFQRFTGPNGTLPTIQIVTAQLGKFSEQSDTELDQFLMKVLAGSTIELAVTDDEPNPLVAEERHGFAFPLPPTLSFDFAGQPIDLTTLPAMTDADVDKIAKQIAAQFARQSATGAKTAGAGATRPLVAHMFRDWLESLGLNTLDAMQNAWTTDPDDVDYSSISMSKLLDKVDWESVAGRTGRYLFGGVRIPSTNKSTVALLDQAGLMLKVPSKDFTIALKNGAKGWMTTKAGQLTVLGQEAAAVGNALPNIKLVKGEADAVHRVPRKFDLPDKQGLTGAGLKTDLVRFTTDLRGQLAVFQPKGTEALLSWLALWEREDAAQGKTSAEPLAARFATLFDLSVRLDRREKKTSGTKSGPSAVVEILGTSEAQRRPLDALFPKGEADPVLADAAIYLSIDNGQDGFEIFQEAAGLSVARATTVRERQPGDDARTLRRPEDDLFFAQASDLADFVELLRRAAIVNAAGTYLLFDDLSDRLRKLLAEDDARISVIIAFPASANARIPARAINAAVLDDKLAKGKRLMAMVRDGADAPNRLLETVSLREPGSTLLRFWRKPPLDPNQPGGDTAQAHLDALFDMMEFGVTGAGGALPIAESLPLSSEFVSRDGKNLDGTDSAYTDQQRADFRLPDGWENGLRYDLLVPLYRWAKHPKSSNVTLNPYNALLQNKFAIEYGWRDVLGNRLGSSTTETVTPYYEDALEPVGAWPGVGCAFSVGAKPNELILQLFDLPDAKLSEVERATLLLKIIHQLEGPFVEANLASSFGTLATPKNFALELAGGLRALMKGDKKKEWTISVTPSRLEKHPRFDLRLTVERTKGYRKGCPDDIRIATSPIKLVRRGTGPSEEAVATLLAREFRACFAEYTLAQGIDDDGSRQWWAVDRRILPRRVAQTPDMLAQPPLALAALSARNVEFSTFEKVNGAWKKVTRTVDVPSIDSDAVFADLLDRIERFVGPGLAPKVTRNEAAFSKVMKAKHELLSPVREDQGLFRAVRGVELAGPDRGTFAATAARRVLRQAAGNDFRAFYEVATVLVQPMTFASGLPANWFGMGESAPKLHGRLKFAEGDAGIRSMTYGIPLTQESALAIALFSKPGQKDSIDLSGKIDFEITHIEREVEEVSGGAHATPAASSWLTLIPFDKEDARRTIEVTTGALKLPTPVRALPRPPVLTKPQVLRSDVAPSANDYAAMIASACRWQYRFKLTGLAVVGDEACCRLVYNVDPTSGEIKDTNTAANPLFPNLAPELAKCQQAMAGIWEILSDPESPHFAEACDLFATLVADVAKAITTPLRRASFVQQRAEDRFTLKLDSPRTLVFRFADHIDNNANFAIQLDKARANIGETDWKAVSQAETRFSLPTAHDGKDLPVWIDGMRIPQLQSVWAAASIRRNATMHPLFTYRTEELFVQEPVVPYLEDRSTISLGRQTKETLQARLSVALKPLFAKAPLRRRGNRPGSPAQLRLAVESVRLFEKLASFGVVPEPDPKVQLITEGEDSAQDIAGMLATLFEERLGQESIGFSSDARLILSVLMLTNERQPLLDIKRIAISLEGLTT